MFFVQKANIKIVLIVVRVLIVMNVAKNATEKKENSYEYFSKNESEKRRFTGE